MAKAAKPKVDSSLPPSIQEQELLRSSIDGAKLLKERENAVKALAALDKDIKDARNTRQRPNAVHDALVRSDARRKVLVDVIKSIDSLLNKKLPDKKSMELTDPQGKNPLNELSKALSGLLSK